MWYPFKPYVSVAKRRANAAREVAKLKKKGQNIRPVSIEGRKIATTFWGQAWCKNLEAYSDFSNRLPRGRTYVCNGSVVDLQIKPGKVTALVSGSSLYRIAIEINKLAEPKWKSIREACAGQIGSIVELLQGRLSKHVMEIVTQPKNGLFPEPGEIAMKCSCPDWAGLCKHLAAVLYGVGARLDDSPEMLFTLRQVDHVELVEQAVNADGGRETRRTSKKTIAMGDLADVFGIEIESAPVAESAPTTADRRKRPQRSAKAPTPTPAKDAANNSNAGATPKKRSAAVKKSRTEEPRVRKSTVKFVEIPAKPGPRRSQQAATDKKEKLSRLLAKSATRETATATSEAVPAKKRKPLVTGKLKQAVRRQLPR